MKFVPSCAAIRARIKSETEVTALVYTIHVWSTGGIVCDTAPEAMSRSSLNISTDKEVGWAGKALKKGECESSSKKNQVKVSFRTNIYSD